MIELAEFEYALSEIFDERATDDNHNPGDDAADEYLKITPLLRLFHHRFPICRYYLEYTQDKKPELPFPDESFCAVTRRDYKLGLFTIHGAQYYFLKSMQQGKSVAEAKDELIKVFDFDRAELEAIWPKWKGSFIASGLFSI